VKMAGRLARLASRHAPSSQTYQIVLYDATTGVPLPGHEPRPDACGSIWIPDNGRGPDPYGDDAPEARGNARCD